jgi:ABC-type antimicrobial peptide transport system permease subunit
MARAFWPNASPIGQRVYVPEFAKSTSQFVLAAPGTDGWIEIVGVVGDTPNAGLREPPAPAMYTPYTMMLGDMATVAIRTAVDPLTLARGVRERVRTVDPNQAVTQVTTAEQMLAEGGWARERFVVMLLGGFGASALALAGLGLFSVVSFAVSQRVREFSIRLALGARGSDIVELALSAPLLSIGLGLSTGVILSAGANRIIAQWSVGRLTDPLVLVAVAAVLVIAATAAVVMPATRAVMIQPAAALRVE